MSSQTPRKSLLERLFSMEGLLLLAGMALLLYGLATGTLIAIFWGVMAVAGQVALHFVRKKDWQAHWSELERQQKEQQKQPRTPDDTP